MRTVAEYRKFAEECRRLARTLTKPDERDALAVMAATWEKLAKKREAELAKQNGKRGCGTVRIPGRLP